MALFRKARSEREMRADLERLLVEEFERQGVTGELMHDPDDPLNTQLRSAAGTYGFANILLVTLSEPEKRWAQLIRDHVRRVSTKHDMPDLSDPGTLAMLRARIMPDDISQMIEVRYATPFASDLIEILCLDLPETVKTISDSELTGLDVAALRAVGRANLALESVSFSDVGGDILMFEGESFFVPSQLVDPQFVARQLGAAPRGIVAGLPDRHTLLVHVVKGAASVTAISTMAGFMSTVDRDQRPGGFLSPHLYYLSSAGTQQITELSPDGETSILAGGAFLEAINGES
jgi:hypothetical protein